MPKVHKGKTATVPTKSGGQYSYAYADLADVVDAAGPLLVKHGLSFSALPRRCEDGAYELQGVLRHGPTGGTDSGALPLFGRSAQELGSAITYARRYLLGCLTGIITDADDDAATAQQAGEQRTRGSRPARQAERPTQGDDGPQVPPELEAARQLAWGVWRKKHGDTWAEFVEAFARMNDGADVNNATVEQLSNWAAAFEGGEVK